MRHVIFQTSLIRLCLSRLILRPGAVGTGVLLLLFFTSIASAGTMTLVESTIKAALSLDKQKADSDKLTLQGQFQLNGGVVDPATEVVSLAIGPFSREIPPGAFIKKETARKTTWTYKGDKGGFTKITIVKAGEKWTFNAIASGLSFRPGPTNPITINLQIGDDSGAADLFFVIKDTAKKRLLKFPTGKKDDADGDGFTPKEGDCDDQEPTTYPGAPELCNGYDDNCNNKSDEGFDLGTACTAGVGACQNGGTKVCSPDETTTVCNAVGGAPSTETCNGVDDDCDGAIDEDFDAGMTCTVGVGSCTSAGVKICTADGVGTICNAIPGTPGPELCGNGRDDNCNDAVDEGFDVGAACTVGVGACERTGAKVCAASGGGTVCNVAPGTPTAEICNNIDDNCDGQIDEGLPCGVGPPPPSFPLANFQLTDSHRVSPTEIELTYSADIHNTSGASFSAVTAIPLMRENLPHRVMHGPLQFENVADGATVKSRNTFTVRVDETIPFDPITDVVWDIEAMDATTLAPNAKIIDGSDLQIRSVEENALTLLVSATTPIWVDDILSGVGPDSRAFLRRVVAITPSSGIGLVTATTVQATLSEAIEKTSLLVEKYLRIPPADNNNKDQSAARRGAAIVTPQELNATVFQVVEAASIDLNIPFAVQFPTLKAKIEFPNFKVEGEANITTGARLLFRLQIDNSELIELRFATLGNFDMDEKLTAVVRISFEAERQVPKPPLKIEFAPIAFVIGGVPVVITPFLEGALVVKSKIESQAGITAEANLSINLSLGVECRNRTTPGAPVMDFLNECRSLNSSDFSGGLSAFAVPITPLNLEAKLGPNATFVAAFFGLAGPEVGVLPAVKVGAKLEVKPLSGIACLKWKVSGALEGEIGLNVSQWLKNISPTVKEVFTFEKSFYEDEICGDDITPVAFEESVAVVSGIPKKITLRGQTYGQRNLTFFIITPPSNGTVDTGTNLSCVPSADGKSKECQKEFTYMSTPSFLGQDSFQFRVDNGAKKSEPATVTIQVRDPELTVEKLGSGSGKVTSDPPGIDCGPTCNATFVPGAVALTADPDPGFEFKGWGGACSGASLITVVTITNDAHCTATFTRRSSTLTVSKAGHGVGTVASTPRGIDCDLACPGQSADFDPGTVVQLTATPSSADAFTGWSGDCSGTATTTTVTVDVSKNCQATFDQPTLTVTKLGSGAGTVTSTPGDINCGVICTSQTKPFPLGTLVQLTAISSPPNAPFGGWGGDCSGTTLTTTISMDAVKNCTALFGYEITQVTSTAGDHKWPAINTHGDMVWSQQVNGFWQVFRYNSFLPLLEQITFEDQNHERPAISDDGTIAWFEDNSGSGIGWQVIGCGPNCQPSSSRFTIQTSTYNNSNGQHRDAGRYFGIASNGATISYFSFCDASCSGLQCGVLCGSSRRFNVSGVGQLPENFLGYDHPDINNSLVIAYTNDFPGPRDIYLATTQNPFNATVIDSGQFPHLADGTSPQLVYVKNGNEITTMRAGSTDPPLKIDNGLWADVNNNGWILYEKAVNGVSQIFLAKPR